MYDVVYVKLGLKVYKYLWHIISNIGATYPFRRVINCSSVPFDSELEKVAKFIVRDAFAELWTIHFPQVDNQSI